MNTTDSADNTATPLTNTAATHTDAEAEALDKSEADISRLISAARSLVLSKKTIEKLSKHPDARVRIVIAKQPFHTYTRARRLALDSNKHVRATLAANPNVYNTILDLLTYDLEPSVRATLTLNPSLRSSEITALAQDEDASVRRAAARSALISLFGLEWVPDSFAKDEDPTVREVIATYPALEQHTYRLLANDEVEAVRVSALGNPIASAAHLLQSAENATIEAERSIATNPSAPEELLLKYGASEDTATRVAVAFNHSCPTALYETLANDPEPNVRRALAENPRVFFHLRLLLSADDDDDTSQKASALL